MTPAVAAPRQLARRVTARGRRWLLEQVGGPARFRVIAVLAGVVALDGADKGTVSAAASNLEHTFGVGNTDIGLLVTASSLVGAVFTVPAGAMTDRVRRTRLLAISVITWAAAMVLAGAATSYVWLILARVALGAVTATAGPAVASLTGDYFPARERARMYGYILSGELVGTGMGFVVSGWIAAHASWRYTFWWLALPSAALAVLLWRLAEPARGGQSRLSFGQEDIPDESEFDGTPDEALREEEEAALRETRAGIAARVVQHTEPYRNQVLTEDPAGKSLWWAIRYVLRVRTDVVIIVASALGYFYFSGLRTFAVMFAQGHFHISKGVASTLVIVIGAGALAGVLAGGRASDWLMERGVVTARVIVPAVVLLSISAFLAPAYWVSSLWIGLPLLTVGAALLGAANPPQDAARLDIIHPHLWGRSEGIRSALRGLLDAAAPLTFGLVSDHLFGGHVNVGTGNGSGSNESLALTFLLFLIVVVAAGLIVLLALRTYPRDVATADASLRNTLGKRRDEAYPEERSEDAPDRAAPS